MVRPVHKWGRESSANHDFYPLLPINLLDDAFADFMTQLAVYYSEKDSLHRLQIGFVGGWQLFPLDSENYIDGMERLCLAPQDSLSNQTFGVIGEGDRPLVWQDGRAVYGGEIKQGSIFKVRLNAEAEHTQEDSNGEEIVVKGEWRIVEPVLNGEDNFFLQQMLANTYDSEGYNTISNVAGSLDDLDKSQFSTFFDFGVPGGVGWVDGFPLLPSTSPNWNSLFLLVDKASDNIRQEGFQIITDVNSSSIRTLPSVPAAFAELTDDLRAVSAFARNRKPDGTWSDWTYRINNIQARKGIEWVDIITEASEEARRPKRVNAVAGQNEGWLDPTDASTYPLVDGRNNDEARAGGFLIVDTKFPHIGVSSLLDVGQIPNEAELYYDQIAKGLNVTYNWHEDFDIDDYDILTITGYIERYWQSHTQHTQRIRRMRREITPTIYPIIHDLPQRVPMIPKATIWKTDDIELRANPSINRRTYPSLDVRGQGALNYIDTTANYYSQNTLTGPEFNLTIPTYIKTSEVGLFIGVNYGGDLKGGGDMNINAQGWLDDFFNQEIGGQDRILDIRSSVETVDVYGIATWWNWEGSGHADEYKIVSNLKGLHHTASYNEDDKERIFYIPYITVQAAKLPR